ncbi:hypothetical protein OG21DRAFT_1271950 [Imleria badia]|nr:hypothetical protein OG21DRAFT_1271950 [Imleria badia]
MFVTSRSPKLLLVLPCFRAIFGSSRQVLCASGLWEPLDSQWGYVTLQAERKMEIMDCQACKPEHASAPAPGNMTTDGAGTGRVFSHPGQSVSKMMATMLPFGLRVNQGSHDRRRYGPEV